MFCIVILWSQRHALAVSGGEHRIKTNRDATAQPRPCGQSKTSLSHAAVPAGPRPPRPHRTVPGTHARPDPPPHPPSPPGRKGEVGGEGKTRDRSLRCPTHPAIVRVSFPALGSVFDTGGGGRGEHGWGGGDGREGRGGKGVGGGLHSQLVMRNRSGQTKDLTSCLSACLPVCLPVLCRACLLEVPTDHG